jgi:uncharacterized protein YyaL (SSP411 family)
MLYDQAQLALAYLEAAQASGDDFYAAVAEDTLAYVLRDMTAPEGGFYSAEDADSIPPEHAGESGAHKSEGAFYIWSDEEIGRVLGDDAEVARRRFGIQPGGNAPSDPQGEFTGRNLLYVAQSIDEVALATGRTADDVVAALGRIREALVSVRAARPRPHLDDKILTAWNGLMMAAFARASRVLVGRPTAARYLDAARHAAAFVRSALWTDRDERLLRRFREGEAAIDAYAEDHAYLIFGLLELFQADGDPAWLQWAVRLQARQDERFWDAAEGGWYSTSGEDPNILLRLKEDYDGAEPAASSVSVLNLLTLAHLTGDPDALAKAERTLGRYGPRVGAAARAVPMMLCALSAWHAGFGQVAIVAAPGDDGRELQVELARHYLPFSIVVPVDPGRNQQVLGSMLPFLAPMSPRDGRAAAYVCRDFACRQPVTTAEELGRDL